MTGIFGFLEPGGIAASVPMFIEVPDGDGGFSAEAQLLHDRGSAVAAEIDEFAIVFVLVRRELDEASALLQERSAGQHLLPKQLDGGKFGPERARPIGKLCACLDRAVVSADDLAHARRVAAAAYVFQQAGVVEVGDGLSRPGPPQGRYEPRAGRNGWRVLEPRLLSDPVRMRARRGSPGGWDRCTRLLRTSRRSLAWSPFRRTGS